MTGRSARRIDGALALDNDDPDAGVAVLGPGADTEDLGFAKLLECRP
jgi:hypothetical protein